MKRRSTRAGDMALKRHCERHPLVFKGRSPTSAEVANHFYEQLYRVNGDVVAAYSATDPRYQLTFTDIDPELAFGLLVEVSQREDFALILALIGIAQDRRCMNLSKRLAQRFSTRGTLNPTIAAFIINSYAGTYHHLAYDEIAMLPREQFAPWLWHLARFDYACIARKWAVISGLTWPTYDGHRRELRRKQLTKLFDAALDASVSDFIFDLVIKYHLDRSTMGWLDILLEIIARDPDFVIGWTTGHNITVKSLLTAYRRESSERAQQFVLAAELSAAGLKFTDDDVLSMQNTLNCNQSFWNNNGRWFDRTACLTGANPCILCATNHSSTPETRVALLLSKRIMGLKVKLL